MMSVFTLVSAFVGGTNVAMDTVAGERERHSLLPLLLNQVRRRDILLAKWLALSLFSLGGLIINLLGFASLLHSPRILPFTVAAILPLALLAAASQLLISTECRTTKEAQTYLSMLVFLPMGVGMYQVFHPTASAWRALLPVMGQQLQIELWMEGMPARFDAAATLAVLTGMLALLMVAVTANRFQRDEIIYGN